MDDAIEILNEIQDLVDAYDGNSFNLPLSECISQYIDNKRLEFLGASGDCAG
jgi:hypothetical protein